MKSETIIGPVNGVNGHDHTVFRLVGADSQLQLTNNTGSRIFFMAPSQELDLTNDANERVYINSAGSDLIQATGLSGITRVFGFANPNEFMFLNFGQPGSMPTAFQTDHHGGTLVSLDNGARIDFVGAPHVGVIDEPMGITAILRNIS